MYQRAVSPENMDYVPAGIPANTESGGGKDQAAVSGNIRGDLNIQNKGILSEAGELLSRLRLSSLDTGDLLLAAILYFTLHDSGDDDLFWIAAILFLTGRSDKKA